MFVSNKKFEELDKQVAADTAAIYSRLQELEVQLAKPKTDRRKTIWTPKRRKAQSERLKAYFAAQKAANKPKRAYVKSGKYSKKAGK